jgi:hypothetical protein
MSDINKVIANVCLVGRIFPSKDVNDDGTGIRVSADLFTGIRKKLNPETGLEDPEGVWTTVPSKLQTEYHKIKPIGKAAADSVRLHPTDKDALVKGTAVTRDYKSKKGESRRIVEILVFSPIEVATGSRQNLIQVRGNIGKTPVMYRKDGIWLAEFSLAVNRNYKNKDNAWVKSTTWFTLQVTDKSGLDKVKALRKGLMIYAEGQLDTDRTSSFHKPVIHVHAGGLLTLQEEQLLSHPADKQRQEASVPDAALDDPFMYDDVPPPPRLRDEDHYEEVAESLGNLGLFDQDPVSKAVNDNF